MAIINKKKMAAAKLLSKAKLKGHDDFTKKTIENIRKPSLFRRTIMLQVHRALAVEVIPKIRKKVQKFREITFHKKNMQISAI